MRSQCASSVVAIIKSDQCRDFRAWKRRRKFLVRTLGRVFILSDLPDLSSVFAELGNDAMELLRSSALEDQLLAMLEVSVLHFFRRSFDEMTGIFPWIQNCLSSNIRAVCRAATSCLRFLAEESSDNYSFLRDSLDIAKVSLLPQQRSRLIYNALAILREAGRFLPTDVVSITVSHFPEIWGAACSTDSELRLLSVKVIKLHLTHLPANVRETYAESVIVDCLSKFNGKQWGTYHGPLLVCHSLYRLFPELFPDQRIEKMLERLVTVASVPEAQLLIDVYDFITDLALTRPSAFHGQIGQGLFLVLIAQVRGAIGIPELLHVMLKYMHVFMKNQLLSFPVQELLRMIEYCGRLPAFANSIDPLCEILYHVFVYFPAVNMSPHFFTGHVPTLHYLQALAIRPMYLAQLKENLMEYFGLGIRHRARDDQQIVSLLMVKTLNKFIFDDSNAIFEMIRPFGYSSNVRIRSLMAEVLPAFCSGPALSASDELFRLAVMDESKEVRIAAVRAIKPEYLTRERQLITHLLADPSWSVRRAAIPIIAESARIHSIYVLPVVETFLSQYFVSDLFHWDTRRTAKACSVLPIIARHFAVVSPPFVPTISWLCLWLLSRGDELPALDSTAAIDGIKILDLRTIVHRDLMAAERSADVAEPDIDRARILQLERERWLDERDSSLFETLGELSAHISPFLMQTVPVFVRAFKERRSTRVLLPALRALTKFVVWLEARVDLIALFPDLMFSLMELLQDEDIPLPVSIAILQLTGTLGATKIPADPLRSDDDPEESTSVKSPCYFTTFVMKALTDMLKEPSPSVFEAITQIFSKDTEAAMPFLGEVLAGFSAGMDHIVNQTLALSQLEHILLKAGTHVVPYFAILKPLLLKHFAKLQCIRICCVLSFQLKGEFRQLASLLYPIALQHVWVIDSACFSPLVRFISFSILFQEQPFEFFLESIEKHFSSVQDLDDNRLGALLSSISLLVQLRRLSLYSARLARLSFGLFRTRVIPELHQLLYSLSLYGFLPLNFVERSLHNLGCELPHLSELRSAPPLSGPPDFVHRERPQLPTDHLTGLPALPAPQFHIFRSVQVPVYDNAAQWLGDLCVQVVSNSPAVAIRACVRVIDQSQAFRHDIFGVAFLSCWQVAEPREREAFSGVIRMILEKFSEIDPRVLALAEQLDRAGAPLALPDDIVARASTSPALALYYFQRHLRRNPSDQRAISELLALNSQMRRIDSARGLLAEFGARLTAADHGDWSRKLGDWERALELYERQPHRDIAALIDCYAHLELWENIRALSSEFAAVPATQRAQTALDFAWAEFHARDRRGVAQYLPHLKPDDLGAILFKIIFCAASGEFQRACELIDDAFRAVARARGVDASQRLFYAQHLVELREAVDARGRGAGPPPAWQHRLRMFAHDGEAWRRLIEIRSLVLAPEESQDAFLKVLSVLRKERRWKLIDAYCARFFPRKLSPRALLSRLKVMWSRGQKHRAVLAIAFFTDAIAGRTGGSPPEEFVDNDVGDFADQKTQARFLRVHANWQYRLYSSKTSPAEALLDISRMFEASLARIAHDFRAWSGFAYASARAISHFDELRAQFAANAISGFLRATHLRPSGALEFLCQLFAIVFRYAEALEHDASLPGELQALPPALVNQAIPQIVSHISHSDPRVRAIVQAIIRAFGEQHFEVVVFPLHLLLNIPDKAAFAQDVLDDLGQRHLSLLADARLFIDGMRRSAVTWTEKTLVALENATRAHCKNDRQEIVTVMDGAFEALDTPTCEQDRAFLRTFGAILQRCRNLFEKFKSGDRLVARPMWDNFRTLFCELEDRVKKTEFILLPKVSEELASRRGFALAVPGTYEVGRTAPLLASIDPTLTVLATQQHPRVVFMTDARGRQYKFLLKGNEDLRLDQRIMQFFDLINSLLAASRGVEMAVLRYAIVPFAPNAGLIAWVTGADTFQQLVSDFRALRDIPPSVEMDVAQGLVGQMFNGLSALQRFEVFEEVARETAGDDLREMLWLRSPDPDRWLVRNHNFTVSTALMSIAGYVIGLGDRHPSNIMVQRHTGRVIHIDFGDSFEVAMNRSLLPERVPFRMTRMIVNALDGSSVEGLFRRCCEEVLWVIRENQSSVIAQLDVFIHEPIFYGRDTRAHRTPKEILERVAAKLSGNDPKDMEHKEGELDAIHQADILIRVASNPHEYVRHYGGWCPFW